MKFCLVVVYIMENIFSYRPNLKFEIGGNGNHFKNDGHWVSIKYFEFCCNRKAIDINVNR